MDFQFNPLRKVGFNNYNKYISTMQPKLQRLLEPAWKIKSSWHDFKYTSLSGMTLETSLFLIFFFLNMKDMRTSLLFP